MNLTLKRFSQDVDLSNPNEVQYFLVFQTSDGREVRLPVQKETTEALVSLVYGQQQKEAAAETVEEQTDYQEQVSDDEEYLEEPTSEDEELDDDMEDEEPDVLAVAPKFMKRPVPETEDEVPSL